MLDRRPSRPVTRRADDVLWLLLALTLLGLLALGALLAVDWT